jgi:hypothetical protein
MSGNLYKKRHQPVSFPTGREYARLSRMPLIIILLILFGGGGYYMGPRSRLLRRRRPQSHSCHCDHLPVIRQRWKQVIETLPPRRNLFSKRKASRMEAFLAIKRNVHTVDVLRSGAAFASSSLLFLAEYFSFPVFGFFGSSGSVALCFMIGTPAAVIFFAAANCSFRFELSNLAIFGIACSFDRYLSSSSSLFVVTLGLQERSRS